MGLLMLTTIRRQVNARDRRTIPWVHARLIKEVNGSKMPDGESPERRAEKREDRVGAFKHMLYHTSIDENHCPEDLLASACVFVSLMAGFD